MTKYVIAILFAFAILAGLLLYIGDDPKLVLSSSASSGPLAFNRVELTWQAVILLGTALLGLVIGIWSFVGWLWRLPSRLKSGVGLRRRNQALDALEDALIAGADGDVTKARKKAEKARQLINSPDLGRMVSAQAAEACGDSEEAIAQYTAMLESDKTLATGQRGLAHQLLAKGDLTGAMNHASRAYSDNKNARWAFDTLFQAQVSDHQWEAALETLDLGEKRKHIDRDIARRRRAVLRTAHADVLSDSGQSNKALDIAVSAAQDAPAFSPATALAAKLLGQKDGTKKALQLIEKSWAKAPHPALSLAYRDLLPQETPKARNKQLRHLYKANPKHRETLILQITEALKAGDAVSAWSSLAPLLKTDTPSARLCSLAAKTEASLNNAHDSRIWLERAATAPSEPDWSDLDPKGEAFDYSDQDWRRLVFSYGMNGELIHPRYEKGAARRTPLAGLGGSAATDEAQKDGKDEVVEQTSHPDTDIQPAETQTLDKDDLAGRLDSLLDKSE